MSPVSLPPIATRREAVALADRCLDALLERFDDRNVGHVWLGRELVPVIVPLRQVLSQTMANALEGASEPTADLRDLLEAPSREALLEVAEGLGAWARRKAWSARQRLREREAELEGLGTFPPLVRREGAVRVLALPRTKHHLRDIVATAEYGRTRDGAERVDVDFVVFTREHVEHLRARNHPAVLAGAYAPADVLGVLSLKAELGLLARAWREEAAPGIDPDRWRQLIDVVHDVLRAQITTLGITAAAITRALQERKPDVLSVGNPCTLEGAVGVHAASSMGIPSLALQHGDYSQAHAEWARSDVTMITAWGEAPAATLVKLGVTRERIIITGAPWADALHVAEKVRRAGPRRVLVALSGAGHAVGLPEHTSHVRRIVEASRALPDVELVFRLHPKDKRDLYERMMRELPGSKGVIVEGRSAPPIHDELPKFDALLTVTSASAMDAMLHGLPVVTLARAPGEVSPAFVEAGTTTRVDADEDLATVLRRVLGDGQDPETRARARAWVARYFGPRDGGAAARVAGALLGLARANAEPE
ncbi:capsular biosynthesis protein [Myxococcota bacterium]|nr:capsular biosynthesis protein [Myxococcota bacterium]